MFTKIKTFFILSIVLLSLVPLLNLSKGVSDYSLDSLFKSDVVESYYNLFVYKVLGKSPNINKVILGDKDFLFLGNKNNHILMKTQNLFKYSDKNINTWVSSVKSLQDWYEKKNIQFIIVVIPNKQSFYAKYLPRWIVKAPTNITSKLLEIAQKNNIHILNVSDSLQGNELKESLVYYKKDSHWNNLGASIGYNTTIDFLNHIYQVKYKKVKFKYVNSLARNSDLLNLLKLNKFQFQLEKVKNYVPDENVEICYRKIYSETKNCKLMGNRSFSIHRGAFSISTENALNSQKLLFMSDSFSTATSKLYNQTFTTIWNFHYNDFFGNKLTEFIEQHQPGIVIYQIVERNLYNNYFIKK